MIRVRSPVFRHIYYLHYVQFDPSISIVYIAREGEGGGSKCCQQREQRALPPQQVVVSSQPCCLLSSPGQSWPGLSPLVGQNLSATIMSNQATVSQTIKWLEGHCITENHVESWDMNHRRTFLDHCGLLAMLHNYILQIELCMMATFLYQIKYWLGEKLDHLNLLSSISKYPAESGHSPDCEF